MEASHTDGGSRLGEKQQESPLCPNLQGMGGGQIPGGEVGTPQSWGWGHGARRVEGSLGRGVPGSP